MMNQILFPDGNGGHWLSNLIWHLEHNDTTVPSVDTVFDGQALGSIPINHVFEIRDPYQPQKINYFHRTAGDLLFSCEHLFIHYLNNSSKLKYHGGQLHKRPWLEQFFELSNGAYYYLNNQHYQQHYCNKIDLDYSLIFCNPTQFVAELFVLLNNQGIEYTANTDYVLASMAYYRSTCLDPGKHYNNYDSIFWLAFCHAIALTDQLVIAGSITDLETSRSLLEPHAAHFEQRVKPLMFEWNQ